MGNMLQDPVEKYCMVSKDQKLLIKCTYRTRPSQGYYVLEPFFMDYFRNGLMIVNQIVRLI